MANSSSGNSLCRVLLCGILYAILVLATIINFCLLYLWFVLKWLSLFQTSHNKDSSDFIVSMPNLFGKILVGQQFVFFMFVCSISCRFDDHRDSLNCYTE